MLGIILWLAVPKDMVVLHKVSDFPNTSNNVKRVLVGRGFILINLIDLNIAYSHVMFSFNNNILL